MIFALLGIIVVIVAALEWSHHQERSNLLENGRALMAMVESQNSLLRTWAGDSAAPSVIYQPTEVPSLYGHPNGQSEDDTMPPLLNEMFGGFGEGQE